MGPQGILEGARGPMQCAPQETFDHSDLGVVKKPSFASFISSSMPLIANLMLPNLLLKAKENIQPAYALFAPKHHTFLNSHTPPSVYARP